MTTYHMDVCTLWCSGKDLAQFSARGPMFKSGVGSFTPRACARGKVIGCVIVVVSTKIAKSQKIGV